MFAHLCEREGVYFSAAFFVFVCQHPKPACVQAIRSGRRTSAESIFTRATRCIGSRGTPRPVRRATVHQSALESVLRSLLVSLGSASPSSMSVSFVFLYRFQLTLLLVFCRFLSLPLCPRSIALLLFSCTVNSVPVSLVKHSHRLSATLYFFLC